MLKRSQHRHFNKNKEEALQHLKELEPKKRLNFRLGIENYRKFKKKLIEQGLEATEWVNKSIDDFCSNKQKKLNLDKLQLANKNANIDYKAISIILSEKKHSEFKSRLVELDISISQWLRLKIYNFTKE
jgi:hypothetical protein